MNSFISAWMFERPATVSHLQNLFCDLGKGVVFLELSLDKVLPPIIILHISIIKERSRIKLGW